SVPAFDASLTADALLLEIFQRAGMERHRRAILHLVVERKALGLLVHLDDVGLLLHQRLGDDVGVLVTHPVAGDDQVPDFRDVAIGLVAGIGAAFDAALAVELAVFLVHLVNDT